ncbi:MAG: metallophosphoesterase family protein [Cellulophaga sp.]
MKIAVLSDIHGNIFALKAVLNEMKKQKIEVVFSLGDCVGYYDFGKEVIHAIDKLKSYSIAGNHERIFLRYLKADQKGKDIITKKYGQSFETNSRDFEQPIIDKIKCLPETRKVTLDGLTFLLCHGSPREKDEYIYPDTLETNLKITNFEDIDYVFNGHTHYPMIYLGNGLPVINVGSVGQSRHTGGIANWGMFNTKNKVYTPQSTLYDVRLLEACLKGKEQSYLYKILRRNNKEQ